MKSNRLFFDADPRTHSQLLIKVQVKPLSGDVTACVVCVQFRFVISRQGDPPLPYVEAVQLYVNLTFVSGTRLCDHDVVDHHRWKSSRKEEEAGKFLSDFIIMISLSIVICQAGSRLVRRMLRHGALRPRQLTASSQGHGRPPDRRGPQRRGDCRQQGPTSVYSGTKATSDRF